MSQANKRTNLFKRLETAETAFKVADLETVIANLTFDNAGLIPTICQDTNTKAVLMMAWMNQDALLETLSTGQVCYWSRSRAKLWRKGESSGQTQKLIHLYADCDGDTLLVEVEQNGVACHTGRMQCFYNRLDQDGLEVNQPKLKDPKELYSN